MFGCVWSKTGASQVSHKDAPEIVVMGNHGEFLKVMTFCCGRCLFSG